MNQTKRYRAVVALCFLFFLIVPVSGFAEPDPKIKQGCAECHRFSPSDPMELRKAPDLFFAGNKFRPEWLKQFLIKPEVIRKAGFSADAGFLKGGSVNKQAHPALSEKDAGEMGRYLLSLKLPDFREGKIDAEPLSRGTRARTKYLFERNYGCIACHEGINLAGKVRGGVSGPSLAGAGRRLNADWVLQWLKTPKKFVEKSRMPVFDLEDELAVLFTKYIMTLKHPAQ